MVPNYPHPGGGPLPFALLYPFIMKNRVFSILATACAVVLSSCNPLTPATPGSPFAGGDLPAGVVRGPDGMLRLDPNAPPTAREAATSRAGQPRDVVSHWDGGPGNG